MVPTDLLRPPISFHCRCWYFPRRRQR